MKTRLRWKRQTRRDGSVEHNARSAGRDWQIHELMDEDGAPVFNLMMWVDEDNQSRAHRVFTDIDDAKAKADQWLDMAPVLLEGSPWEEWVMR